jgi:hypothetical protein
MGSLKNLEPYWWETKPQRLSEWLNEWRRRVYHENPRAIWRIDYDLAGIAAVEKRLQEKLYWQRQSTK